jgi:hypothetical protein
MRTTLAKARVASPAWLFENAVVEVLADDDVTMTANVKDRRGVVLAVFSGPFEARAASAGYVIHTADGDVYVTPQSGCGCGGTSQTPLTPEEASVHAGQ